MPARALRFQQGEYYHIYNRGAGRQRIFQADTNYHFVLRRMGQVAAEHALILVAYCLMPNHYHWLVRQDGLAAATMLPQHVFNSYTKAYNKLYRGSGTLFEGRFKAKLVGQEDYLLHLCRYIHANPVNAGLVPGLSDWPYSNYLEWIGARSGTLLDRAFVDAHFPDRAAYTRFVQEYIDSRQLPIGVRRHLQALEQTPV